MKSTKRALILSFCSILLSAVMLVGTTFAWFTDTATTSLSPIQSGTLNIVLEYATAWDANGKPTAWADAKGQTLNFRKAADALEGEAILWEPGSTYRLPELRISNGGNLALKYKVAVTGIDGDTGLLEVITWTIKNDADDGDTNLETAEYHLTAKDGTNDSDILSISGTMQEDAGNEYQNLTLKGIGITVVATQDTIEYDSTTKDYDKDAAYPVVAGTLEEFTEALKTVNENETLVLTADITGTSAFTVASGKKVAIDLNGKTLSNTALNTFKVTGELTIEDSSETKTGKVANSYTGSSAMTIDLISSGAKFTLLSGTVEGSATDNFTNIAIGSSKKKACTVNIVGGTVTVPEGYLNSRAIVASNGMTLNITGGTIHGGTYGLDLYAGSVTTIIGGSVTANAYDGNTEEYGKQYGIHMKGKATLTVGALDAATTPTVQGIKFESSGVKTELPTINLIKGDITNPIYSLEKKYNYDLFKLGIVAAAPVTFADNTANYFLPDGLKMVQNGEVWTVQ